MMMMMMTQRRYVRMIEHHQHDHRTSRYILAARPAALQVLATVLLPALLISSSFLQWHTVAAVRNIQVAFPLQSLTIWDPEVVAPPSLTLPSDGSTATATTTTTTTPFTFRAKFLSKFQKGLQAEVKARNTLQQQHQQQQQLQQQNTASISDVNGRTLVNSKGKAQKQHWATQAARNDQRQHQIREGIVERAYDDAIQQHEQEQGILKNRPNRKNPNRYQFVGVINSHPNPEKHRNHDPITWYTRAKPKHAKWTIRLIHVNRAAILKDLYNQKKIDIFAHYQNESRNRQSTNGPTSASVVPTVTGQYRIRERSWKNVWNMSLKHMFTDSSGMYWRERRIHSINSNDLTHQFLYTDGNHVYEATYRYMPDGRNGMHKVSTLAEFLNSRSIDSKMKQRIVQRLQNDTPDIVLEE